MPHGIVNSDLDHLGVHGFQCHMASGILACIVLMGMASVPNGIEDVILVGMALVPNGVSGILAWIILMGMALVPNGIRGLRLNHVGRHDFSAAWNWRL